VLLLTCKRVAPAPVGTADGLEECVQPERLVEVHDAFDLGVEPGQQLGSDDQEPKGIGWIAKTRFDVCFGLSVRELPPAAI